MYKLVMTRHGQSQWNLENRFTGWTDVDLTEQGIEEAKEAGRLIKAEGLSFDVAHTSVLKRAIRTLWQIQDVMDLMWLPVLTSWRLNERHYGALTGLDKAETAKRHGDEQVHIWRRSYDTPPPALEPGESKAVDDPRYANVDPEKIPLTECLKDTVERVVPYWKETLVPAMRAGQRILLVAHGNSMRALVKYLDGISDEEITGLNIPTGVPLVYEFDDDFQPIRHYYLGDQDAVEAKAAEVAKQGKSSG